MEQSLGGERQLLLHDHHLCPQVSLHLLVLFVCIFLLFTGGRVDFFLPLDIPIPRTRSRFLFANMAQPDFAYRSSKGPWGTRRCGPRAISPTESCS